MSNPKDPKDPKDLGHQPRDPNDPLYDPNLEAERARERDRADKADEPGPPHHGGKPASKAPPDADPNARIDPDNPHGVDDEDDTSKPKVSRGVTDPDYQPGGKHYVPPQPPAEEQDPPDNEPLPPQAPSAGETRAREHDIDPDLGPRAQQPDSKAQGKGRVK